MTQVGHIWRFFSDIEDISGYSDAELSTESALAIVGHISTVRSFLQFHGWDDFEEVADDAVIGSSVDGGVSILVDRGDGARAFHAHDVLDCAADFEREI